MFLLLIISYSVFDGFQEICYKLLSSLSRMALVKKEIIMGSEDISCFQLLGILLFPALEGFGLLKKCGNISDQSNRDKLLGIQQQCQLGTHDVVARHKSR